MLQIRVVPLRAQHVEAWAGVVMVRKLAMNSFNAGSGRTD